jgi:hypothetical protein
MALYFLSGYGYNLASRGTVTASPGSDTNYPLANLYDAKPFKPWRASSSGANTYVQVDLDLLADDGFESGALGTWIDNDSGTGVSAISTGTVRTGTYALSLNGGAAGTASVYQDINVRAGERFLPACYMNLPITASVKVYIMNRATGLYLQSNGTWSTSAACLSASTADAAWQSKALASAAQVEAYQATVLDWLPLRVTLTSTSTSASFVDDCSFVPGHNFMSVHGHNLTPAITAQYRISTDVFVADNNLKGTLTQAIPSMYAKTSDSYDRYVRLYLSGTPYAIPYVGELVIGYAETLTASALAPQTEEHDRPQTRNDVEAFVHSDFGVRTYTVPLSVDSTTAQDQLLDIQNGSKGSTIPVVMVPHSTQRDVVMGRLEQVYSAEKRHTTAWDAEIKLTEMRLPTFAT